MDDAVQLVREHVPRTDTFSFWESNIEQLDALHRQIIAAVAFDRLPASLNVTEEPVDNISTEWILTGKFSPLSWSLKKRNSRYRLVDETRFLSLYSMCSNNSRGYCVGKSDEKLSGVAWIRSIVAVVIVFTLTGMCVVGMSNLQHSCTYLETLMLLAVAIAMLSLCVCMHTLQSPNGTAVYAGKAKLWLLCGIPDGYLTQSSWSVFLPAYPPAMSIITYVYYYIAGICDNWLVQIIPFSGIFWCMYILFIQSSSLGAKSFVLLFFSLFTPVCIVSGFYPDGYVALVMLISFSRLQEGDDGVGTWLIAGVSTLFKNEGIVFYISFAIAMAYVTSNRYCWFRFALVGAAPAIVWHGVIRLYGGGIDGFAMNSLCVFFQHIYLTLSKILDLIIKWDTGLFVLAIFFLVMTYIILFCRVAPDCLYVEYIAFIFVVSSVGFVVLAYGFCSHWNITWRIKSSLLRVLWTPSVISLFALVNMLSKRKCRI